MGKFLGRDDDRDLSVRGKLQGERVTRATVHKLSTVHPRGRAEGFRCLPSRMDDFQITAASPVVERFQPIRREADWYNCLPSIVAFRQQSLDSLIVALISNNNVTEKDSSDRQILRIHTRNLRLVAVYLFYDTL